MDYYKILEIEKNASEGEIKKAYRRLSLIYHPDKQTGDSEKFKKINEAYQVLSSNEKRVMYDMQSNMSGGNFFTGNSMGQFPFPSGFPFGNMKEGGIPMPFGNGRVHIGVMPMGGRDGSMKQVPGGMDDIFNMLFSNMSDNLKEVKMNIKPTTITKNIEITIQQAYTGMNYPLEIERWIEAEGVRHIETETIYVPIPKGIDNNEIIVLNEKGNCNDKNVKGDIKLYVKIINNSKFIRKGLNLYYNYTITLKEALLGFIFQIEHLNGKTYTINSGGDSIVKPDTETTIKDMGFERNGIIGNIVIKFDIVFPKQLSENQKKKLKDIL
jgi:DnaJ family protein B protein 4